MSRRCVGVDSVVFPQDTNEAFLSPRGPSRTGGTLVYRPMCRAGRCSVSSNLHGASLSIRGAGRTRGTRVYLPLCGAGCCSISSKPPRGVPIPPRPRQDQRDFGVSAAVWGRVVQCLPEPRRGVPIPPRPRQGRRDSGVSNAVWGCLSPYLLKRS